MGVKINNNSLSSRINRNSFILLLIVAPISMTAGVLFPLAGLVFEPYLLISLGLILFVNLIRLNPKDLLTVFARPTNILIMSFLKPLVLYTMTYFIYPKLTLSATLLSGISTALGAPFAVNFVGKANLSTMVGVIIITSIAAPFTLPTIIYFLFKEEIPIPIFNMMFLLAMALFIPLFAVWLTRKKAYRVAKVVDEKSLHLSLILIVFINFPVFARFSGYFFVNSIFVIELVIASFLLFGIYGLIGYYFYSYFASTRTRITRRRTRKRDEDSNNKEKEKEDRITGLLAMTYISNVLVVVIAHQFFDIRTEALAAFYQIPYYGGLLFLKRLLT